MKNKSPKKINSYCLISREYPAETGYGGIGTYVWHMARLLSKKGIKVTVLSMSLKQNQEYVEENINVVRIYCRSGNILQWYYGVTRFLLRNKFDIVEDSDFLGSSYFYQSFFKTRSDFFHIRLHTCHKVVNYYENKFQPVQRLKTILINYIEENNTKLADLITSPSDSLKKITGILWDIPNSKIHVIPNPFDFNFKDTRIKNIKDNFILYFGRIQERKSAELMLNIIKNDFLKDLNLKFYLIGKDEYQFKSKLKEIKNSTSKKVKIINHTNNRDLLYSFVKSAKIVFLPSKFENFPYTVLEALYFNPNTYVLDNSGPMEIMTELNLQSHILQELNLMPDINKVLKNKTKESLKLTRGLVSKHFGYEAIYERFQSIV